MTVTPIGMSGPRRAAERLQTRVTPDGGVQVRLPGTPWYTIAPEAAERSLEALLALVRRRRWGVAPDRTPVVRASWPGTCHRRRDGGLGPRAGCRRRRSHEGQCSDAAGLYTPAACLHLGRGVCTVTLPDGTSERRCQHCNEVIG